MLATLTAAQQAAVTPGARGGSTSAVNHVPVSGAAGKAVAFAFMVLNARTPYVYGGTGPPGPGGGFDCSGLVQAAWASAGVSLPRTTYEQVAAVPAVSTSTLQPGDILFFDGDGHEGIYVGGGKLIDAPQTGQLRGEGRPVRLVQREPGQRRAALSRGRSAAGGGHATRGVAVMIMHTCQRS